jgi:DNA-directed RNA polymerase subunit RPC12/RpoP
MLRIACEQCGEALTLVAASNLAPDGYVVTNPACPHCGARKW